MAEQDSSKAFVYVLRDPGNQEIRYVGKTRNPKQRLIKHVRDSKTDRLPIAQWVRHLADEQKRPIIEVIETCTVESVNRQERYWILNYASNSNLLNKRIPAAWTGATPEGTPKRFCRHGHELTPENSYSHKATPGLRLCKTCKEASQEALHERKPLLNVWAKMIQRCDDPNYKDWRLYGGRAIPIRVCAAWYDYETFAHDVGLRPSKRHSLDRIDNNLGYQPGNCRWATPEEQGRNTRRNIKFEYNGETLTLAEWAERTGIDYLTLYTRLTTGGMLFRNAITVPIGMPTGYNKGQINGCSRFLTFNGETLSISQWAERTGISAKALGWRINRGMDIATALSNPVGAIPRMKKGQITAHSRLLTFNGKTQPIIMWAEELGVSYNAFRSRILRGMPIERAFEQEYRRTEPKGRELATYHGETLSIADWATRLNIPLKRLVNRFYRGNSLEHILTAPYKPRLRLSRTCVQTLANLLVSIPSS